MGMAFQVLRCCSGADSRGRRGVASRASMPTDQNQVEIA
jgi:hypothetical protein